MGRDRRLLKATVGAHEVISTIMLNYIAIWIGAWLFGLGGPLQSDTQASVPVSNDIAPSAHLPVFWGDPELQGLHVGLFVALAALVVFWVILNRSTTGYEVRAVGLNPEAARYGGISVARNYILVMAVCGLFAGIAGAMDVLGWQFRIATNDIPIANLGFLGIAVALLGRNTAVGTLFGALLFGALFSGTSQRNLDPTIFEPELAGEPHDDHPGPRRARDQRAGDRDHAPAPAAAASCPPGAARDRDGGRGRGGTRALRAPRRLGRHRARRAGLVHRAAADPAAHAGAVAPRRHRRDRGGRVGARRSGERRLGWGGDRRGRHRRRGRDRLDAVGRRAPRGRRRVVGADRGDAALRHAAASSARWAASSPSAAAS